MKLHKVFKILIVFAFLVVSGQWSVVSGSVPYSVLDSGNANYAKGNYTNAIKFYKEFMNNGVESAQAYYNMGNCYYRLNDIPHALLNYEKAQKLSPGDADIEFNIQLANQKTTDRIVGDNPRFLESKWQSFLNTFSEKGWALLTIALLVCALILIALYLSVFALFLRQLCFWSGAVMFILAICSFVFATQQYNSITSHDTAIVMSSSVTVKAAPADNSAQLFVIHEGAKVWTLKSTGEWTEVKLANGNRGWLHTGDIIPI